MEKSIWFRMASSLPIVGNALAMWIEHTEMGMAQFGTFLGLLRGALIGLVIAAALIAASEAVVALFDVGRTWIDVNVSSHFKSAIMREASQQAIDAGNRPYFERHKNDPLNPIAVRKSAFIVALEELGWISATKPTATQPVKPEGHDKCPATLPLQPCFWSSQGMERHGKLHYLLGVYDAVSDNEVLYNKLFRKGQTFRDHIKRLDQFYANGAHQDIPIIDAMREVRGR